MLGWLKGLVLEDADQQLPDGNGTGKKQFAAEYT
jgi:hypothetical protein